MEWSSEGEDNNEFDWGSDEDNSANDIICPNQIIAAGESSNGPSRDVSGAGSSRTKLVHDYVAMGFAEDLVIKALMDNDGGDESAILETILTYSAIEKSSPVHNPSYIDPCDSDDDILSDDDLSDVDRFNNENKEELPQMDKKMRSLIEMGFSTDDVSSAIARCGPDASISELADSISAAQAAKEYDNHLDELGFLDESPPCSYEDKCKGKKRSADHHSYMDKKLRRIQKEGSLLKKDRRDGFKQCLNRNDYDQEDSIIVPKPMIGFSLPDTLPVTKRTLPEAAIGPPYFYYENVALAPKGVWKTISRFLYDVHPEFVDSKYFCAAARKRGYVHNLPIHNRSPLCPLPPRTIHEALPLTKKWWPSWDPRIHLNCLQTCIASAKLTDRIRKVVSESNDPPPRSVQDYVLYQCRKWNLVWVGLNKVAPLEPDEIESLLGFPKNHTRGGGISRTERYRSLGNSFQVDTVAYHLSVLKEIYPSGITLLSLFSGIGGAEVALHRLGIHMKTVVSVEISEINRNIVRGWWEQTGQTGTLIDIPDVQQLTADILERMIHEYGGFDLVIGGSPCNNLAGSNRVSRDGLHGEHSSLFYDYFRILENVRALMGRHS